MNATVPPANVVPADDHGPPAVVSGSRPASADTSLAPPPGCPSLSAALALARDRCKAAAKDSKNTHHGYKYASADGVIATASEAMNGSGLALIPAAQELVVIGSGSMAVYALNRTIFLSHSSGEFLPLEVRGWPVIPDRGRPLDKAFAIALTSSLAYTLRDLLQMPRGTDDDVVSQDDTRTPTAPPPGVPDPNSQAPAQAPPAPPATITEREYAALVELVRKHNRTPEEVNMMLATVELKVLRQLPQTLLDWATRTLIDGQVSTAQCDRIAAMVQAKKLGWDRFNARLSQRYLVHSLRLLTAPQASEVEQALLAPPKDRAAQRPQPAA